QSDPLGVAAGDTNLYRAEGDNPPDTIDPSGLQPPLPTHGTVAVPDAPPPGANLTGPVAPRSPVPAQYAIAFWILKMILEQGRQSELDEQRRQLPFNQRHVVVPEPPVANVLADAAAGTFRSGEAFDSALGVMDREVDWLMRFVSFGYWHFVQPP